VIAFITIHSNDDEAPVRHLDVTCTPPAQVTIHPEMLEFTGHTVEAAGSGAISIDVPTAVELRSDDLEAVCSDGQFETAVVVVAPDSGKVVVTPQADLPLGQFESQIRLRIPRLRFERTVPVHSRILGHFYAVPPAMVISHRATSSSDELPLHGPDVLIQVKSRADKPGPMEVTDAHFSPALQNLVNCHVIHRDAELAVTVTSVGAAATRSDSARAVRGHLFLGVRSRNGHSVLSVPTIVFLGSASRQ
jgi:hypothetical protein